MDQMPALATSGVFVCKTVHPGVLMCFGKDMGKLAANALYSDLSLRQCTCLIAGCCGCSAVPWLPPETYPSASIRRKRKPMRELLRKLWLDDKGEDIAEYGIMPAMILVIVVGTIRLVSSNANTVFSETASSIS